MASIALKSFVKLRLLSLEKFNFTVQTKPLINVQNPRRFRVVTSKFSLKVSSRNLRVAIIGGGQTGGTAAETLAKGGIETFLIERKLDDCKPCGGAIPLCMSREFDLPLQIIDRKVTMMKIISPSNVAVDIGRTLKPHEYIRMVRREVLDSYLRNWAKSRRNPSNLRGSQFIETVDIISSIEFDRTGDHLATGDRGGRAVLFERTDVWEIGRGWECCDRASVMIVMDNYVLLQFQHYLVL